MAYRKVIGLGLLLSGVAGMVPAAYADIGGIGSPVVLGDVPAQVPMRNVLPDEPTAAAVAPIGAAATPSAAAAPVAAPAEHNALLVIRFNQPHVYYQRSLQQAVSMSEKAKPGATYDVVSIIPSASRKLENEHIGVNAERNLQAVAHSLQDLGVSPSQIHTSTETSAAVGSQEIKIFVN